MSASAALNDSLAVYHALGWTALAPDLGAEEILALPLGTPEQQRIALAGLKAGEWGSFDAIDAASYGWRSWLGDGVHAGMLALFAIRVGVPAKRAVAIAPASGAVSDELLTAVVADRGAAYAQSFVAHASAGGGRMWIDATSRFAGSTVRLVHEFALPIPENLDYLRDWAVYALGAPANEGWLQPRDRGEIPSTLLGPRFREHAEVAVALGLSVTGPFGGLLQAALDRGWLDADAALELAFAGLDAAQRPGDRKVWAAFLTEELGLTGEARRPELLDRADALVSAIATGDAPLAEAFGPALIALGDDDTLLEVLQLGLSVKSKKARRALLSAAAGRPAPSPAIGAEIAGLVEPLRAGNDVPLARAATRLLDAWGIAPVLGESAGERMAPAGAALSALRGRWEATPPLWEVPRFSLGLGGAEALATADTDALVGAVTAAAAELSGRPEGGAVDPVAERLLALANELARRDPDLARTALRGVRQHWVPGLRCIAQWVAGEALTALDRPAREDFPGSRPTIFGPSPARDAAVTQRLGEVPVLLSTPTWDDMRISADAFTARLRAYASEGAVASEADVLLALLRVDPVDVTPERRAELRNIEVAIVGQDGAELPVRAGAVAAEYFAHPLAEPDVELDAQRHWWAPTQLEQPPALAAFPARLKADAYRSDIEVGVLPLGGDWAALTTGDLDSSALGLVLRQLVRRREPLTPGQAVNLVGAQRGLHERAIGDGALAIREAWERGLLVPGAADVRKLGWADSPTKLAAFATACLELADEGMLAVVWPLLDDLVALSLAAPRRLAGTAELVEAIGELLPSVTAAVDTGDAPNDALEIASVRALAAAGGASRAVQLAKAIVAALPQAATGQAATGQAATAPTVPEQPAEHTAATATDDEFAEFWPAEPAESTAPAVVDDGAVIRASWHDPDASTRLLEIELEFAPERLAEPADGPRRFRTRTSWFYDIEEEGQCGMTEIRSETDEVRHDSRSWLRWDAAAQAIRIAEHRNWRDGNAGPLGRGELVPPITVGMVAVLLSGMNHDNGSGYHVLAAVRNGLFGADSVRLAVARLLESPDFTPVKLAGMIEAEPDTLRALWPVLTESVRVAGSASGAPPRWLNRVLDAALLRAPSLAEAARRGLLPPDSASWPGLSELAERKGSQAALRKARELAAALGG
ncbi:hypothetical protein [Leucobacter chromiireducens]|uniref:Uncharacterized protein n=1 Tax=Leucobacter chromiireducens subsp. chromiireducens TaxID=660067 RepID=A0ABS1SRH8_9MICO|nr:hypothetical protein [Leucobacter chromiireducens]MBL3690749.1 hypothetical protein [Leucobacter chromiireducens subsp. chromiireducens]